MTYASSAYALQVSPRVALVLGAGGPGVDVDERPGERRGRHCMLVHLARPQARMMALPSRTT